jgi:bifunctional UDP-N-acetylglucosamine pyrophosphorylase / glucosamine-1-phosphate N-acetyltransferase
MSFLEERRALAVVLAAGEGTRMKSALPKVLHRVAGRTMLAHVLASVEEAGMADVAVVIGPGRDDVRAEAQRAWPQSQVFVQEQRRGTAHAVLAAREALAKGYDDLLILFADTPLVKPETMQALRRALTEGAAVAVLGFRPVRPFGYGRLVQDSSGALLAIKEEKDASPAERAIDLCNAGLMALDGRRALELLSQIDDRNAKGEFYLTDVVATARAAGLEARVVLGEESEVLGVNDRVQLAEAEKIAQDRLRRAAMMSGVTMIDPASVYLSADAKIAADVTIEPHVWIGPKVEIGEGAVIHAFSHIESAKIGPGANVGPFARLRPGADLGAGAKVGNFVEIKAAKIGPGAKVSHLTYLGDAEVGAEANIGAGTITCNYDGFLKYRTVIGEGAFIGSNSSLVAPVTVGAGAYVGSGSVVTKDVSPEALAIARGQQVEKPGWARLFREKQSAKKRQK